MPDRRHPLFARFFDRFSRMLEVELAPRRAELVAGLSGHVLEIGAGNGINFRHYAPPVAEVVALEPEPYLRERAHRATEGAAVRVVVQPGVAESLEFEDGSFDAAVASLVLCSVRDEEVVLAELRRVLKPGGELRFFEHVRAEQSRKRRLQQGADRARLWPLLAGGCHCSRDTVGAIAAAGFRVGQVRRLDVGPGWMLSNPHVLGAATR